MKLMTKAIENKFSKYPLYSQDGKGLDSQVVVKFFSPIGSATWLITEGAKQEDGDWLMFGYCNLGYGWEWGYVSFNELSHLRLPYGLTIEREMYSKMGTVREMI